MFIKRKFTNILTILIILLLTFFLFFLIFIKLKRATTKYDNFLDTLTLKETPINFENLSPLEEQIWRNFTEIPPKEYSKYYVEIAENNRPLLNYDSNENIGAFILNTVLESKQLSPKEELYILNKFRIIDAKSGDIVNTIKLTIKYLNLAEKLNSPYDIARAKIALSSILYNLGGTDTSINILKSIDLTNITSDKIIRLKVLIYLNLAETYLFMKKYDKSIEYLNKLSIQLEQEEKEYKENVLVIKSFLLSQIYTEIGKQDEALKLLKSSKKLMDSIKKQYFQDLKILYIISLEGYNLKYDIHNFSKTSLEKLLSLSDKNSNIVHLKITFKLLSQYYFRTNNIQAYNSLTLTYEKYLEKINSANNTVFSLYLIESLEHSHFLRENERLYKEIIFLIITIFIILIISYKKITILNKKAKIDVLTNIGNRLAFTETFDEIKNENFFMFIFDIDNFKKINDTYGHDFGDEVLSVVGKILKTIENKEISIYRVGGEEFAIIFTHFNESFAIECCEYIRKSIENIKWKYPIIVTISGGFSNSCENTYLECDKRLYKAKNSGKNMIIYQNIDKGEY